MRTRLRQGALGLAFGFLPLGSVLAGKLWVWQGLLLVLVGGLALTLWAAAALLPEPPAKPIKAVRPRGKHKPETVPEPAATAPRGLDLLDWLLVACVAWQGLSWFVSVYRFGTSLYLAELVVCAVLFWLCRYALLPRQAGDTGTRTWRAALWALVGGGIVLSVLGLREYVRTVFFLGAVDWRVFGPMVNPNAAAGYLLVTLFPVAALLLGSQSRGSADGVSPVRTGHAVPAGTDLSTGRPRYAEIAALFSLVLMFATLLLTGSKAALGALLVGIVLFGLLGLSGNRRAQAAVIGVAVLTVVAAFLLPPIRVRLLSAFGWQSHSTVFRLYTWQGTLHMIQARPWLGFGAGTFEHIFPRFAIAGFTRAAHQSFLQLAAETGVPGLLLGLAWGVLVLRRLWQTARSGDLLVRLVAAAALAGLTASALQELFDYAWYVPGVAYSFFALAGIALAAAPEGFSPAISRRSRRRWWSAAAVAGLLLTVWCGRNLIAEVLAARGQAEAAASACAAAAETYGRAAAWNPGQAQFPTQISRCEESLASGGDGDALARAVQARMRAVRLQPTEPQHYLALARLYEAAGRTDEALAAARTALQNYPNYPRGLAELGQLQEQAGEHAAALQTYRQLAALQEGPVGRYAPSESLIETAYARGWLALGDEATHAGQATEALADYSRATVVLEQAINGEMVTRESTGGESLGLGNLQEDTAMAEEVLGRLRRTNTALSGMRQAQLLLAMRRRDEARPLLERLVELHVAASGEGEQLAVKWSLLRLAQELQKDQPQRAAQLAQRAMAGPLTPSSAETAAKQGWLAADTASLTQLQRWAETMVQSSVYPSATPL
ncbi:O-antigen ligase family protein [bacterium]|nr:O-antigen ligase family protein [bacterium]